MVAEMIVSRSLRFCVLSLPKKCSLNVEKSFNALWALRGTLVLVALAVLSALAVLVALAVLAELVILAVLVVLAS